MTPQERTYLRLASREIGMLCDYEGWPPSNRGTVKHLLRKGYLEMRRTSRNMVHITAKGRERAKRCRLEIEESL